MRTILTRNVCCVAVGVTVAFAVLHIGDPGYAPQAVRGPSDPSVAEAGARLVSFLRGPWSETVAWEGSWNTPGGDFDKRLSSYWIGEAREGETLYFDITDFVNDWLKEPSKNFGIIVKVSGPFLGTFAVDRAVNPKLRILY